MYSTYTIHFFVHSDCLFAFEKLVFYGTLLLWEKCITI